MRTSARSFAALVLGFTLAAAPVVAADTAPAPGNPQEGIQVHGHWVIEVRDPDGQLAGRREFHNALVTEGAQAVGRALTGSATGPWGVAFAGSPNPCPNGCVIWEPRLPTVANPSISRNLTVARSQATGTLTLRGNHTVPQDGSVSLVQTLFVQCLPSVAATACLVGNPPNRLANFTSATLATPIAVVTGQQVLLTVTITFTNGGTPQ